MLRRSSIVVAVLAAAVLPGCAVPRGPINIEPFLPRWLSHGEIGGDCPQDAGAVVHPDAVLHPNVLKPPRPKFHPVPTRPVFEPAMFYHP